MSAVSERPEVLGELEERFRTLLGHDRVETDADHRELLSLDFSEEPGEVAGLVVQPETTTEVSEIVRSATASGAVVVVRGGGMSYTRAHLPDRTPTVLLDMRRMNRVVEINEQDLYVTIQAGITWEELKVQLRPTGLRIPFFGTLSGRYAQIGGGLSQNSAGIGKRFLSEHVRGLEVVLGDGRVLRTGTAATGTTPYSRHFGPDLAGLFLSDGGAFGVKTECTLRLERRPSGTAFGSYAFDRVGDLVDAQVAIQQAGVAIECLAFDDYLAKAMTRMPPPPASEATKMVRTYLGDSSSRWRAARQVSRMMRPGGMSFLEGVGFALSVVCDAGDQAAADRRLAEVNAIVKRSGGRTLPPALPFGMRYGPLPPVADLMIGMDNECNFPSNIIVPLSRAHDAVQLLDRFFAEHADTMQQHGIFEARNYLTFDNCFGIEPIIFWKTRLNAFRLSFVEDEAERARLASLPDDPDATAAAVQLRHDMISRFRELGTMHIQIGKTYPYRQALGDGVTWEFLQGVKAMADPNGILNPGVLGLD